MLNENWPGWGMYKVSYLEGGHVGACTSFLASRAAMHERSLHNTRKLTMRRHQPASAPVNVAV